MSVSAATPGSAIPSRNSKEAPPPVEMWVIRSASPAWVTAATESPPPTMEVAPLSAMARATAKVPSRNGASSNTPIGPFHTTVLAPRIAVANACRAVGPMSSPIQPAGIAVLSAMRVSASAATFWAITWSMGSRKVTPLARAASSTSRATSSLSASSSDAPISIPCALRKV